MDKLLRHLAVAALFAAGSSVANVSAYDPKLVDAIAQDDRAAVEKAAVALAALNAKTPALEAKNDLAAARIVMGQYDSAIELLREAETLAPGKSVKVANNLGAALERKGGSAEDALYWVREGYKRDANEHEGSGWLHVRSLEAQVAAANDPKWFEKNSILGYDFGAEEEPVAPGILPVDKDGRIKGVDELLADIAWQIEDRQKFASPPDLVIGDLAASAGDLVYAGTDGNPAKHYELALKYGAARSALITKRLARFRKLYPQVQAAEDAATQEAQIAGQRAQALAELREKQATRRKVLWIGGGVLLVALVLAAGWAFDRFRKKPARAPLPDIDYDAIDKGALRKP